MNKNQKIVSGIVILLVAVLVLSSTPNILNVLGTYSTTVEPKTITGYTGTYQYTDGAQQVYDRIRGKNILQGTTAELFDDVQYVTSWYSNGDSEKILLCGGNQVHVNTWNAGFDYVGQPRRPGTLVGRYWFVGYYYPPSVDPLTGSGTLIFGKNYVNSNYVAVVSGSFDKQKFGNVGSGYTTTYSKYALGGESEWWFPTPQPGDYAASTGLTPGSVAFKITGQRSGTIKTQLVVEYCELSVWGFLNSVFGYHYNYAVVQQDIAELKSGIGNIDVTSTNSLSGVPGYTATGTGDPYTKYVYQEGKTVTFHVKTGTSGQTTGQNTADKNWKFEILKGTVDVTGYPVYLNDGTDKDITWTIPIGTGNQDFTVRLTNGLLVQSESKIYSVSEINKIPGRTTITSPTSGSTITLGKSISVAFKASPNPVTLSPISRFDGWAKYYSATSGSYAFSSSSLTATNGQGSFSFTPDRTGNVYIQIHAIDQAGFIGAESDLVFVNVINQPKYLVAIVVSDSVTKAAVDGAAVILGSNTQTTVNGVTQFTIESGNYYLAVYKTGYTTYSGGTIEITGNQNIPVPLVPITTTVKTDVIISVYDSSTNTAIIGAIVNFDSYSHPTTSAGTTVFSQQDQGAHSLSVSKDGYDAFSQSISVPTDLISGTYTVDLNPTGINVTLYTITITVSNNAGAKLSGAIVTLGNASGTTDINGVTALKVPVGFPSLKVTATGYQDYEEALEVTGDEPEPVTMIANNIVTYDLTINVVVAGGTEVPLSGALIDVDGQTTVTSPTGMAILNNLMPGPKTIKVTKVGYTDATSQVDLNSSQTVKIVMTGGKSTPGFETVIFIIALGIVMAIMYARRKKR